MGLGRPAASSFLLSSAEELGQKGLSSTILWGVGGNTEGERREGGERVVSFPDRIFGEKLSGHETRERGERGEEEEGGEGEEEVLTVIRQKIVAYNNFRTAKLLILQVECGGH